MKLIPVGSSKPEALYTDEQVERLCGIMATDSSLTFKELESITGIKHTTISNIYEGKQWKHISAKYDFKPRFDNKSHKGENNGRSLHTAEQAEQVCKLLDQVYLGKSSLTHADISKVLNVEKGFVDKISSCVLWKNISKNHVFVNKIREGA